MSLDGRFRKPFLREELERGPEKGRSRIVGHFDAGGGWRLSQRIQARCGESDWSGVL